MNIKMLSIDEIDLSVRAQNALHRAGVHSVGDMLQCDEEKLNNVRNLGKKSITEILEKIAELKKVDTLVACDEVSMKYCEKLRVKSIFDVIYLARYRIPILEYVRVNDISIEYMGLSNRPRNQLLKNDYKLLSEIIFMDRQDFLKIPAMGIGSVDEIMSKIFSYLREHNERLIAICNGDESSVLDDKFIASSVMKLYERVEFAGLSFADIKDNIDLPVNVDDVRLKKVIGELLASNELEYVDYRCYPVYAKFKDFLEECTSISERGRECIRKRLEDWTLESIAQEYGITRERVRQIINKDMDKAKREYVINTGKNLFDEDYYKYFYITYEFDKKDASKWLGIPEYVWSYLEINDARGGNNDLELALGDENIDTALRLRIQNYLNRDSLFIDGEWVKLRRLDLENAIIKKFCIEDTSYDDFCELYNVFLETSGVEYNEKIYMTDTVYKSRINRLSESRILLWKMNSTLRYYDIDSRDYTELLNVLNLERYENIELSVLKFMTDYPDIMKEYDIRDQYELHNLLRKIVPEGSYNDFHCERMPDVRFGTFNREEALFEVIKNNAPINSTDLCEIIKREYGYDVGVTMSVYLRPFSKYYHQGVYSVEHKVMSAEKLELLQQALVEDFYFIDEIKSKYLELFQDGDVDEINSYNLKIMGFNIYSAYVIKKHLSADEFFEYILTKDDIVDISGFKKKFWNVQAYYVKLTEIKRGLTAVEFEPDHLISFRRLEQFGVTKEKIRTFCEDVYNFVEKNEYFSIYYLKKSGFESDLFELGFSDLFYASLLLSDDRFAFRKMFKTVILRKDMKELYKEKFLVDRINEHRIIDVYDFINELSDDFGCVVQDKWDIIPKIQNTNIYYDKILDRLYANKDLYYNEVDKRW